jgi:hypothetical protein
MTNDEPRESDRRQDSFRRTDAAATFDPEQERASEAVVTTVSECTGIEPTDLPVLADAIDPDALDRVVGSMVDVDDDETGTVAFTYAGYAVEIRSDGTVAVARLRTDE